MSDLWFNEQTAIKIGDILVRFDEAMEDQNMVSRIEKLNRARGLMNDPDIVLFARYLRKRLAKRNGWLTEWRERVESIPPFDDNGGE